MQEQIIHFDEKFWLAIAFLVFVGVIIKYLMPSIKLSLENKSKEIAQNLLEAKEMKERAQQLLVDAKNNFQETITYCEKLTADAEIEAKNLLSDIQNQASLEIEKKMAALNMRLKSEEENAVREMKAKIIHEAMDATRAELKNIKKENIENSIKKSLADIGKIIH